MMKFLSLIIVLAIMAAVQSFMVAPINKRSIQLKSLDIDTIQKLDEMRGKFDRLSLVVSPESDLQKSEIQDVVEKYATFKEIKAMMGKLRSIWRTEASERRRAKQLKSFTELYKGKLEIEEVIKEKLGMPSRKEIDEIQDLVDIQKWDAEIVALEKKLADVSMVIPEGKSTREERFGY
mmetsp:Transcript_17273/g.16606  ORF Transcript_17273/g.16606 Transcript_17273/m.16606 type:complete len:178 (-) Transcript_17273:225-758(-)|eukprot:CAMPEP_0119042528 /NCGR_PEP_ID=MMETSP1177-20130426/15746_1 /TAXON_ID=2985 /ORGANISM="Ochromonas sp, Strain CCMP1899" /LENGTH=177 /DNA_ID=CAMNT_0007009399 /DNA_START=85 /DNA_END=618 /DNA_ORIENTATION=+